MSSSSKPFACKSCNPNHYYSSSNLVQHFSLHHSNRLQRLYVCKFKHPISKQRCTDTFNSHRSALTHAKNSHEWGFIVTRHNASNCIAFNNTLVTGPSNTTYAPAPPTRSAGASSSTAGGASSSVQFLLNPAITQPQPAVGERRRRSSGAGASGSSSRAHQNTAPTSPTSPPRSRRRAISNIQDLLNTPPRQQPPPPPNIRDLLNSPESQRHQSR